MAIPMNALISFVLVGINFSFNSFLKCFYFGFGIFKCFTLVIEFFLTLFHIGNFPRSHLQNLFCLPI